MSGSFFSNVRRRRLAAGYLPDGGRRGRRDLSSLSWCPRRQRGSCCTRKPPRHSRRVQPSSATSSRGQPHAYRLTLTAGDFVRITIQQQGADISATLIRPDGQRLLAVDTATRSFGRKLSWRLPTSAVCTRLRCGLFGTDDTSFASTTCTRPRLRTRIVSRRNARSSAGWSLAMSNQPSVYAQAHVDAAGGAASLPAARRSVRRGEGRDRSGRCAGIAVDARRACVCPVGRGVDPAHRRRPLESQGAPHPWHGARCCRRPRRSASRPRGIRRALSRGGRPTGRSAEPEQPGDSLWPNRRCGAGGGNLRADAAADPC